MKFPLKENSAGVAGELVNSVLCTYYRPNQIFGNITGADRPKIESINSTLPLQKSILA